MKPRKLVQIITTRDGRAKTTSGKEVNAIPIGKPFVLEGIDVDAYNSNFVPNRGELNQKLRNRKGIDAYCLGKPLNRKEDFGDTAGGGHVPVVYVSCPIQLYKLNK